MPDRAHEGVSARAPASGRGALDASLKGRLPCVSCKYDLQGLSIRSECPECGAAVRATILFRVDPYADVFKPIHRPRLLGFGLLAWSGGALLAALLSWAPRLADALFVVTKREIDTGWTQKWAVAGVVISGIGAIALVRPAPETTQRGRAAAIAALVFYPFLAWAVWVMLGQVEHAVPLPYVEEGAPNAERITLRLGITTLVMAILIGLRLNARQLVARSLVMRTRRVDRQTMFATVGCLAVTVPGDLLRLYAAGAEEGGGVLSVIGTVFVLVGSVMTTVAMWSVFGDSMRIRRAVLTPAPSLESLIESGPSAPAKVAAEEAAEGSE